MNKKTFNLTAIILLFFSITPVKCEEATKFQQYIQEGAKPPVYSYSYSYMPQVSFYMPRYSSKYTPRYTFGHSLHFFAMDNYYFNYDNDQRRRYLELQEKDTYTSPNEFKIK